MSWPNYWSPNADRKDIPIAWKLLMYEGWKDIGGTASTWWGEDNQLTCGALSTKEANRRRHTKPGSVPYVPEREAHTIDEVE